MTQPALERSVDGGGLRSRGAHAHRGAQPGARAPAERRDRRERILLWLCAPLLLPAAGAAAAIALLERDAGLGLAVAVLGVPPLLTVWLARRRGWFELVAWPLITVAAELAAVFWVGFVWLGYGPE